MATIGACATSGRELPPETEAEVGRQLSDDLDRQMFLLRDTFITTPLESVGRSIGANAPYSIAPYSFKVVDGETVTAFAIAGGSIYLYRGLIEESGSMGEIAAVLAHEIAHLAAGHASQKLYEYQRSQLGLGQRMDRSRILFLANYSRSLEAEADSLAVGLMIAADWDPAGLIRFFDTLMELREDRPSVLESPFLTHPEIEERMESVRRVIGRLPQEDLAGLRESSAAYEAMIAELDELPPAHESEFR